MAEKPELNDPNNETQEATINPLVTETVEMCHSQLRTLDKDCATTPADASERLLSNQAFEAALEGLAEQFQAMAETAKRLPPQVREAVLSSIGTMTGDNYPAYDLFRAALKVNN